MTAADRQHRLLPLTRQEGRAEVSGAADGFGVAPETIRRDLNESERRGPVRRTHRGAHPVESAGYETSLARREGPRVAGKRRIAAAAVGLIISQGLFPGRGVRRRRPCPAAGTGGGVRRPGRTRPGPVARSVR